LGKRFGEDKTFAESGIRFGKGLQLVNILRDLPADLRQGRCYLPADELTEFHLQPGELLDATREKQIRPIYNRYLDAAEAHLHAGWRYTTRLPHRQFRLKVACALPIMLGFETLALLREQNFLSPERRIKVSRSRLRNILFSLIAFYPWAGPWRRGPKRF
jgi:farnesyl-diphosphate farnesyltransferase